MGHVITFAQQKGGSGKTTLLAHLAHQFSIKKQSVGLLDLDPQGSLSAWADIADIDGLTIMETASYRVGGDIRGAKDRYDYVFVDCPGSASSVLEAAIRESDLVLIPCQPSKMDLWASKPVVDMCLKADVESRIILNRVPPRGSTTDLIKDELSASVGKVLKSRIGNRIAFSRAFGDGKTALSLSGQPIAKQEIAMLGKEATKILKKTG